MNNTIIDHFELDRTNMEKHTNDGGLEMLRIFQCDFDGENLCFAFPYQSRILVGHDFVVSNIYFHYVKTMSYYPFHIKIPRNYPYFLYMKKEHFDKMLGKKTMASFYSTFRFYKDTIGFTSLTSTDNNAHTMIVTIGTIFRNSNYKSYNDVIVQVGYSTSVQSDSVKRKRVSQQKESKKRRIDYPTN